MDVGAFFPSNKAAAILSASGASISRSEMRRSFRSSAFLETNDYRAESKTTSKSNIKKRKLVENVQATNDTYTSASLRDCFR